MGLRLMNYETVFEKKCPGFSAGPKAFALFPNSSSGTDHMHNRIALTLMLLT